MPDLSSNSPVYFIHSLAFGRLFWAYWLRYQDFENQFAPQTYGTSEAPPESLADALENRFPEAQCLILQNQVTQEIYRRIKRAELPDQVRKNIYQSLSVRRQWMRKEIESLGFRAQDIHDLKSLKKRYRHLARLHHPDQGGEPHNFMAIQRLYKRLRAQLSRARRSNS